MFVIIGILAVVFVSYKPHPSSSLHLQAEQAVYEILIANKGPAIGEFTFSSFDCASETCFNFLLEDFPKLKPETITDYQELGNESYPLRDYLSQETINEFIDPAANRSIGWQVSFSRVAFDHLLTQALVLVEDCRGDGCFGNGGGKYLTVSFVFLQKFHGVWYIQEEELVYLIEQISE